MKQANLAAYERSRPSQCTAGGYTFSIRRPYVDEVIGGKLAGLGAAEIAARFVIGWEGVKESDLMPGGDPEEVAFDAALFAAWIKDQPDLWPPLTQAIVGAYEAHEKALYEQGKR
jgi:hypothetical protein